MVLLLKKPLMRKNINLFKTRKSFYRSASYLERNKIISSTCYEHGKKEYTLTSKGQMIALLIETLDDFDNTIWTRLIHNGDK